MPTSFDSLHEETRPLALLRGPAAARGRSGVVMFVSAVALLLPVLIVVLL